MPRKFGLSYIKDEVERGTTFYRLRDKLIKGAADLSVLTGARTAIILEESETGKVHSFGTPSADSVIDSFLSGNPCLDLDDEQNASIMRMHSEVAQLEKAAVKEAERTKALMARTKEIQESSSIGKLIFSKVEDLNADELIKLGRELSRIQLALQFPMANTSQVQTGSSSGGGSDDAGGGDGYGAGPSGY